MRDEMQRHEESMSEIEAGTKRRNETTGNVWKVLEVDEDRNEAKLELVEGPDSLETPRWDSLLWLERMTEGIE